MGWGDKLNKLRFVSWAAVSSEEQAEKESIDDQLRLNREWVQNLGRLYHGYSGEIIEELTNVGTRSIVELREAAEIYPSYARLTGLVGAGAVAAVICRSRDRLGRVDALIVTIERFCAQHNVIIVPRQSPPITLDIKELQKSEGIGLLSVVEAHFAQAAVKRLVHEHERGMAERVRVRKQFPGILPWGYRYRYDRDGTRNIEIDPVPAATIRYILVDLFVGENLTRQEIAERLNDEGHATSRGKSWQYDTLTGIFRTPERYAGYITLNEKSKVGRKLLRVRGDHEPIITDDELRRIKAKLAKNTFRREPPDSVLAGVVVCTLSGRPMYPAWLRNPPRLTPAFRCSSCECTPGAKSHCIVESRLLDAARKAIDGLMHSADARKLLRNRHAQQIERERVTLAGYAAQQAQLDSKEQRLLHTYVHLGHAQLDWFDNEMARLKSERAAIEEQAAQARARIAAAENAELSADSLRAIQSLGDRMFDATEPGQLHKWLLGVMRIYVSGGDSSGKRAQIDQVVFI